MAMWVGVFGNCTLRRPDVLGFCSDDSVLSAGFELIRRRRFNERWMLSLELPLLLLSEMLLSLAVGNGLWSANGITPLSRRFGLYPAPLIVFFAYSVHVYFFLLCFIKTILCALSNVIPYDIPSSEFSIEKRSNSYSSVSFAQLIWCVCVRYWLHVSSTAAFTLISMK